MQRILVMGPPGSGKSTFARKLSAITGIPTIFLDALYWKSGWIPSDDAEFDARVTEAANAPRWIMDGNYISHIGRLRRDLADTAIWFDPPPPTCMIGVMTRIVTGYGRVRPEMTSGCPERFDAKFLRYVWTFHRKQRPRLAGFLEDLRSDQTLMRFTCRSDADRFLHDLSASESVR